MSSPARPMAITVLLGNSIEDIAVLTNDDPNRIRRLRKLAYRNVTDIGGTLARQCPRRGARCTVARTALHRDHILVMTPLTVCPLTGQRVGDQVS
jgi:hypothetical protein